MATQSVNKKREKLPPTMTVKRRSLFVCGIIGLSLTLYAIYVSPYVVREWRVLRWKADLERFYKKKEHEERKAEARKRFEAKQELNKSKNES